MTSARSAPLSSRIKDCAASGTRTDVRLFCLALLVAAGVSPAFGLNPGLLLTQYVHTSWVRGQNFPLPNVQALSQTPDGFLWLGTTNGLFRFDGVRFTAWESQADEALPSRDIHALRVARGGALWIGTSRGVSYLRGDHLVNYLPKDGLPEGSVVALTEDHTGRLWVSTMGPVSALSSIKNGVVKREAIPAVLPDLSVLALYEDSANRMWIGTNHGLCRLPVEEAPACVSAAAILSITEDSGGNILAADRIAHGVVRLAGNRLETVQERSGTASLAARILAKDHDGNVWVGTLGQGLFRLQAGRMEHLTRRGGLSSDLIQAIFEDREHSLWIGTGNGLDRFRNPKAPRLTTLEGLSGDVITAVCATHDGDLWVGTAGAGLNRVHGAVITSYSLDSGLPASTIVSLHEDAAGRLWVGTTGGLVYRSGDRFVGVRSTVSGSLDRIFAMESDPDGSLWLEDERRGLLKARDGHVWPASIPGTAADQKGIYELRAGVAGTLWIGLFQGGVTAVQHNTATTYLPRDGLASGPVNAIHSDSKGILWVGASGGLSRLRNGIWTTWTSEHGVPEGGIQGIIEDNLGALWLSTGDGLLSVPMASLASMPDGVPGVLGGSRYGVSEGIRLGSSRGMANPRLAKSPDGRLWIATNDGLAMIDPRGLEPNSLPPPVAITRISVDGLRLKANGAMPASFHGRELEIEYTALSLVESENNRFSYLLEGLDPVWRDAGTRRTAIYTNLPPGSYRFVVRACNNDGVWNRTGAELNLLIPPFFYQTWWFRALGVLAPFLAGWGFYLLRERTLRANFEAILQERSRITREVHDTVLQGFAGVVFQLQVAWSQFHSAPELARQKLERALEQADESLREARETLSFMRLSTVEHSTLVEALTLAGKKLTEGTSIQFSTDLTGCSRRLRYDLQSHLYILAREAIYNAVNHARASHIKVVCAYSAYDVVLTVQDDGIGFDLDAISETSQHFGISGMRDRARQIGAALTINSSLGRGTSIVVVVTERDRRDVEAAGTARLSAAAQAKRIVSRCRE